VQIYNHGQAWMEHTGCCAAALHRQLRRTYGHQVQLPFLPATHVRAAAAAVCCVG
jgi:hypothetical protein